MKYKDFEQLVELLRACHHKMDKYYDVLKIDEVWNDFNATISFLIEQIYSREAVAYILDEYLAGNNSPLTVKQEDGTIIEYPLNTLKDVWTAMESYKIDESKPKKKAKTTTPPMSDTLANLMEQINGTK